MAMDCLNTVLVKDIGVQNEVHEMYKDVPFSSATEPVWSEPLPVELTALGDEFKANLPVPVFNALVDVFGMDKQLVQRHCRQETDDWHME